MNTLIFAAGLLLGSLAAFVFMFITTALTMRKTKKKEDQILSDDLVKQLFEMYLKETKGDGDEKIR